MQTSEVEKSLEPIAQMLASDGYELLVAVDDRVIDIGIEATPDACVDCLVPQATMEQIIRAQLAGGVPDAAAAELRIRYPR
jgi:hypothetical protein